MSRFVILKDGEEISSYDGLGFAEKHAKEIGGKVVIKTDPEGYYTHCTNCEHFAWWSGDFVCLEKRKVIQPAPDGKFTATISEEFNAKTCPNYEWNNGYGLGDMYTERYLEQWK